MTTTILRLPGSSLPWRFALRVEGIDSQTFHNFIEALKAHISPRARKWSAAERCWLLRECDTVIGLLEDFAIDYTCDNATPDEPRTWPLATVEAFRTLHLLPSAPPYVIQAAYRALAKHQHPDAGGSTADMQKLNRAVEVLK